MQDLVQAVGRGMRSEQDQCETIILDDHVQWFVRQHREFAPQWFLDAYRTQSNISAAAASVVDRSKAVRRVRCALPSRY